jgi:hypothetical protein
VLPRARPGHGATPPRRLLLPRRPRVKDLVGTASNCGDGDEGEETVVAVRNGSGVGLNRRARLWRRLAINSHHPILSLFSPPNGSALLLQSLLASVVQKYSRVRLCTRSSYVRSIPVEREAAQPVLFSVQCPPRHCNRVSRRPLFL